MIQTVITAIYGAALGPPSKSTLFITLRQLDDELTDADLSICQNARLLH